MAVTTNKLENSFYEMLTELKKPSWSDYVKANGDIIKNAQASSVLVGSQSDLANLTGYVPGSIAYTAGFAGVWQLDVDGITWVSLV